MRHLSGGRTGEQVSSRKNRIWCNHYEAPQDLAAKEPSQTTVRLLLGGIGPRQTVGPRQTEWDHIRLHLACDRIRPL